MPRGVRLDGELFAGRGGFDRLVSTVQTKGSAWEGITFQIFDLAALYQTIEERHQHLAKLSLPPWCRLVPHRVCGGRDDLDNTEVEIVAGGGEGCILRPPGSFYRPDNFTKIKRLFPELNRSALD
jgi:DNA ligase-1